jgi:hypothetical protein
MVTLIWGEGRQEAHRGGIAAVTMSGRRGATCGGRPAVVGSVGEVGEHLRARAMLRVGWMGPEEHQRR